ncbi:MAG: carboxypeptidase-like regulatory domain-containing protein [Myxococcota bacterium]
MASSAGSRLARGIATAAALLVLALLLIGSSASAQSGVVLASDDFARADELPLTVGGNWQEVIAGGGTAHLVGGRVVGAADDAIYFWQGPEVFDDARQFARARVVEPDRQIGLVVLGGVGQAVIGAWDNVSGTVYIYWYGGGLYRGNLAVASSTLQADDVIEVALVDGIIYAKVNGTIVASAANTTTFTTGRPGLETFQSGGSLDDWAAGTPDAYTISGTISESGVGLADVLVSASGLYGGSTETDASGHYTLSGVPSGAMSIVVTPLFAGYSMSPAGRTVAGPIVSDRTGEDFVATPSSNAVIASDGFNRPTEVPLVVGGTWQAAIAGGGTAQLSANRIVGTSGDAVYYWQGPGAFDDARQYARARVVQPNRQVGLVVLGGPGQALIGAWDSASSVVYLYWYSADTYRGNLAVAPSVLQAGDVIEVELLDGVVYARVNGAVVASAVNSTTLSSGRPGFETFHVNGSLDDWAGGTPEAYSISGTISEGGTGLAGVFVRASGRYAATTTTDGSGGYSLTGVPKGATSIALTPLLAGHAMTPATQTIAGPIAASVTDQDFTSVPSSDAVVAADDFDRPAELPFVVDGNWQKAIPGGSARLEDDHVVGVSGDAIYYWQGPGTFDAARQVARARVVSPDRQVGVVVLGGPGQAVIAAWDGLTDTAYVFWYSEGVYRGNLAVVPSTAVQAGDVIELELFDGTLAAKVNGAPIASVPNSTTLVAGRPGFELFEPGGTLDDWQAGTPFAACSDGLDNDGDGLTDLADPGCADANDGSEQNPAVACDDGLDNDGDTLIDLADPGCTDPADPSEIDGGEVACNDGIDNDGDGLVDLLDPGCADAADVSEQNAAVACDDGLDNDGDTLIDLADPGCTDPADPSEVDLPPVACNDGVDNDGDGLVDLLDPGCADASDASELDPTVACDDGADNDGDALIDGQDPGCAGPTDASEQDAALACDDGLDNDGDGLVDLLDPGCTDPADASEQNPAIACDDGIDNDGDGLVDLLDAGCADASDASELNPAVACDDGVDNDGDTLIDWPDDPDCTSVTDTSEGPGPPPVPGLTPAGRGLLVAALLGTVFLAVGGFGRGRRGGSAPPSA